MASGAQTVLTKKQPTLLGNFAHLGIIQVSNVLIQLLLFPIITRTVGLDHLGYVLVANTFAGTVGTLVNYGTNQTGIRDVALNREDPNALASVVQLVYSGRSILFAITLPALFAIYLWSPLFPYFLLAYPLVIAELINPLFFFTGIEKLLWFNVANLVSKVAGAALILSLITDPGRAGWVNFYLGLCNIAVFLPLLVRAIIKYRLLHSGAPMGDLKSFMRRNFSLAVNAGAIQFQQFFFQFILSLSALPMVVSAYAFCEKLVASCRIVLVAFSNAVYPRASILFRESELSWKVFKRTCNLFLAAVFAAAAIVMACCPAMIVRLLTGNTNELAILYVRMISIVPLLIALNTLNVIDLLLKHQYGNLFRITVILLAISVCIALAIYYTKNRVLFGFYPVVVEASCLALYTFFIKRSEPRHAG